MRYAIFSDIHGNLPAWQEVLTDIRALEADILICLGDVVGYGPRPQEVLDEIRSVTDYFVLGNHDAAAAGLIDPSLFNDHAHAVVLWTRENLTTESLEFLRNQPLQLASGELLFVHAEIPEPARFGYVEEVADAEANFAACDHFVTFIGHTHHPMIFEKLPSGMVQQLPDADQGLDPQCRYIVNVGSAGEPRNPDDIRARYVIYDSETRNVYFRRIDFDTHAYHSDLASTTLTHTPFFLEALNYASDLEAAHAQDMAVPAHAMPGFNTAQRRLVIPANLGGESKPKPMPAPSISRDRKSVGMIFLTILGIVAIFTGGWLYFRQDLWEEIITPLLAEPSQIIIPERLVILIAVANYSFESGNTDWDIQGGNTQEIANGMYDDPMPDGSKFAWTNQAGGVVRQILTDTLQPNTTYSLSVATGWRMDLQDRWPDYPGYRVELWAGGNLLAFDADSTNGGTGTGPDEGQWRDVSVNYTTGGAVTPGQPLEIRLLSGQAVNGGTAIQTNYDNVRLTAVQAEPADSREIR